MKQLRFMETEYNYADFSTSVSPAVELSMEQRQVHSTVLLNIFQGDSFTVGFLDDPERVHVRYDSKMDSSHNDFSQGRG